MSVKESVATLDDLACQGARQMIIIPGHHSLRTEM